VSKDATVFDTDFDTATAMEVATVAGGDELLPGRAVNVWPLLRGVLARSP
jgi:hypothetical protein